METYAGKLFWSAPLSRLMGIDADLFMATRVIVRRDDYDGEIYSSLETWVQDLITLKEHYLIYFTCWLQSPMQMLCQGQRSERRESWLVLWYHCGSNAHQIPRWVTYIHESRDTQLIRYARPRIRNSPSSPSTLYSYFTRFPLLILPSPPVISLCLMGWAAPIHSFRIDPLYPSSQRKHTLVRRTNRILWSLYDGPRWERISIEKGME